MRFCCRSDYKQNITQDRVKVSDGKALAVCKILLESLAFTKKEMVSILDRVVANCIPKERRKIISDLLSNEEFHYIELQHYNFLGTS